MGSSVIKANERFGKKQTDVVQSEKPEQWKGKRLAEMTERDWRIFREDN